MTVTTNFRDVGSKYVIEANVASVTSDDAGQIIYTFNASEIATAAFQFVTTTHDVDYNLEGSLDGTNYTSGLMTGTAAVGTVVDDYANTNYRYLRLFIQSASAGDHGEIVTYANLRSI